MVKWSQILAIGWKCSGEIEPIFHLLLNSALIIYMEKSAPSAPISALLASFASNKYLFFSPWKSYLFCFLKKYITENHAKSTPNWSAQKKRVMEQKSKPVISGLRSYHCPLAFCSHDPDRFWETKHLIGFKPAVITTIVSLFFLIR